MRIFLSAYTPEFFLNPSVALLNLVIRPRAAFDLEEAVDYYSQVASSEVAERFINEFRNACNLLMEFPGVGSRRFAHLMPGLRFWSLDRFPFRLFYLVEENTLQIIAVDHEKRNLTKNRLA